MRVSRRGVLAGAAIGGGLLVAWTMMPRRYDAPLPANESERAFGAWLKIARDGVVTVAVPQLEMGQGVTTLIPQIVAVELGADWRQVAVETPPPSGAYANAPLAAQWSAMWQPFDSGLTDEADDLLVRRFAEDERFAATARGTTLAAYETPARTAAATARAALAMAAAERWDVAWEECEVEGGFVSHDGKRLPFGELADAAAEQSPPDPPPLRPDAPAEQPIAGLAAAPSPFVRLDAPAKVDGSWQFAGDIRLPDMLYAAIAHGPAPSGGLVSFDERAATGVRGVRQVVWAKRWLAALADTWWAAERGIEALRPRWSGEGRADDALIEQRLDAAVRGSAWHRIETRGAGDDIIDTPDIALRYDIAPAAHATLETASATARLSGGRLELWLASQAPEQARTAAAEALGLSLSDVVLYPMPAGGSFDRRLEHDHAREVAVLAREAGRPVQLVWSRWQEQLAGRHRTPAAALLTAKLFAGGSGDIAALRAKIAAAPVARETGYRLFHDKTPAGAIARSEGDTDPLAVEGAMPVYTIPDVAVDHVPVATGQASGMMRGRADGYTAFFTESFIDEVARRMGREPLSYRIAMLAGDLPMVEVLQRAARLAEWDGQAGSGQGLACHRMRDGERVGRIACIATAARVQGGARVGRISAAVDIGRIVNLDLARQQVEGGLLFGMGLALGAGVSWRSGVPSPRRLAAMNLPRLADTPEIAIEFIASEAEPFDPSELGTAVIAPAIANALFSAIGLRFRRLPLLSGGL